MEHSTFWCVWNPDGRSPTVRHPTYLAAEAEAERLARCNPGQSFYLLKAEEVRVVDDMRRIILADQLPF
ncbi:hypothetical protein [Pseudomonas aeruginosa]|uniref:hypothetical protein n=1 Tax=Pseudomonas aeruginosa TaxID=287 RepID=UPI00259D095D|nr:hypothetical protein [Pseudomonas aeruginosa]EKV0392732.1 hypothetical protein [Pseudomonas aeruginosa]MDM4786309.1 hypothetical protein [Pseudomonas aeruginosa]MDM4842266.1 hypothetical protein [Pseudomonas aeruginosa]MDM5014249.1 hypothetical protein [Pseudomonas aeruginosa]